MSEFGHLPGQPGKFTIRMVKEVRQGKTDSADVAPQVTASRQPDKGQDADQQADDGKMIRRQRAVTQGVNQAISQLRVPGFIGWHGDSFSFAGGRILQTRKAYFLSGSR